MAKCDLTIVLDENKRIFFPGEEISEKVRVESDGQCQCDGLDIALEVSTHGKGNSSQKSVVETRLFVGKWIGQSRNEYAFSLTIPADARPYHGTLLNVVYQLRATADIPWALDPQGTAPVDVGRREGALEYSWDEKAAKGSATSGCFFVPLVVLLTGVAFAGFEVFSVGIMLGIFGTIGVLLTAPKWLSERRLGAVEMSLEAAPKGAYRARDAAEELVMVVKAQSTKSIDCVGADIKVFEEVVHGSGSNRRTHTHQLYSS